MQPLKTVCVKVTERAYHKEFSNIEITLYINDIIIKRVTILVYFCQIK